MSNLNMSKAIAALTSLTKVKEGEVLKSIKAVDVLRAAGCKSTDLISPKSEGSTTSIENYTAFKGAIVAGFSTVNQKLMAAPISSLSADKRIKRKEAQQRVGAYMGSFKRDLYAREPEGIAAAKAKKESGRTPQQNKTGDKVVDDANEHAIKAIKKETELQKWHGNNTGLITAKEIGKLRAKIIALLQPEPVEPSH